MKVRKIKIKGKTLSFDDESFFICADFPAGKKLTIPKRIVIKSDSQQLYSRNNNQSEWVILWVDSDFFKDQEILKIIRRIKTAGHIFLYGNKRFGINFDQVIDRLYSRSMDFCFYCDETLNKNNRTTEHLVPKAILRAYLINVLDDNTVPCCQKCNSEKANLHPYTYREYVKLMIKRDVRYKKVLRTLNSILINKNDPLC